MRNKRESYYDVDVDFEKIMVDGGMVSDMFYVQDLKQRKLFLNTDIDQFSVSELVRHIMQYNKEDKGIAVEDRKPILLYITSYGGEVCPGLSLIDAIESSKTPVYTINLGCQYSMAFLIGLAGHKRFATQNARFLMHDGSSLVYNSTTKVQDQLEFQRRAEDRIKQYVLSHSNLTTKEYNSKLRVEWFMFADEAKEKGFIDYIIGVDCDIDEVI